MCVGWDWQDWVIAILLLVDVFLVFSAIGILRMVFFEKIK